jgi:CYTH domain-containing protein
MANEIERRFLVDRVPDDARFESVDRLDQGYLAIDGPVVVRLRRDQTGWVLCVKGGSGLVRTEIERHLEDDEGEQLWQMTVGRRIGKRRQTLQLETGDVAELDTFDADLEGLQIVEVEFRSEAAATRFQPPDWFGLEVTDDRRWNNAALATTGIPIDADRAP